MPEKLLPIKAVRSQPRFARLAALPCDLWALARRRPSLVCTDKVRDIAGIGWVADPTIARDALDFVPAIPSKAGFLATASDEGFVPPAQSTASSAHGEVS